MLRSASRLRVQPGLRLRPQRDPIQRHAQGIQEPAHRIRVRHRNTGGVKAAQVHIQLPVAEPAGDLMCPAQRERGLADACRPADRGDHHRPRAIAACLIQDLGQRRQFGGPAGEVRHRRGQLPRHLRRRGS
jgi:hypothetical protein